VNHVPEPGAAVGRTAVLGQDAFAIEVDHAEPEEQQRHRPEVRRDSPQDPLVAGDDEHRLALNDDAHGDDDEARHHIGRAKRLGLARDDRRAGHHHQRLRQCRHHERTDDAPHHDLNERKNGDGVNDQRRVAQADRRDEHGQHFARIDLAFPQRRGEKRFQGGALALPGERFQREDEGERRREKHNEEGADFDEPHGGQTLAAQEPVGQAYATRREQGD